LFKDSTCHVREGRENLGARGPEDVTTALDSTPLSRA